MEPKSSIALKFLREELSTLLACQYRGHSLREDQTPWNDVAMSVLGHVKPVDPSENKLETVTLVVNRAVA